MRFQKISLIIILAGLAACVSTTNVETPSQVDPNSSFQAVVTVEVDEGTQQTYEYGSLGVLIPISWDVDSVTYTGPNSGNMYSSGWPEELETIYPSDSLYHWIGFRSDENYTAEQGDNYEISLMINTDSNLGTYDIAFLGLVIHISELIFNGDPCSKTVEVVELNFEQSTWGVVKSEFGPQ